MSKRRWTEKRGRKVVGQWESSGLSMAAFAREPSVNADRLRYWRNRLAARGEAKGRDVRSSGLVPGVVVEVAAAGGVILQLPGGVVLETTVASRIEPQWVAELVRALEGAP